MTPSELLKEGGDWLLAARNWLQRTRHNGSDVVWSSADVPLPIMTVRDVEDVAAHAACAMERTAAGARFRMLLTWLKDVKQNEVETFDEDCADSGPYTKEDLGLLYDEVISVVEAIRDGKDVLK